MAKVNIKVDTETCAIVAEVDGQIIEGLNDVSISCFENYDGELEASVRLFKAEKQGEMKVMTHYAVAVDKQTGKASIVKTDENQKAQADIAKFFKKKA